MSLQVLWSIFLAYPGQSLNGVALFFALSGSWLLLATRIREQRAMARLVGDHEVEATCLLDEPVQRINRYFYRFGYITLAVASLLSWGSTQY